MGKELTTDIFIKRCVDKHGDLYDYSLVDYKKMKEKVDIRCVKHDIKFKQLVRIPYYEYKNIRKILENEI
jgi:hypothetical protein